MKLTKEQCQQGAKYLASIDKDGRPNYQRVRFAINRVGVLRQVLANKEDFFDRNLTPEIYICSILLVFISEEEVLNMTLSEGLTYLYLFVE